MKHLSQFYLGSLTLLFVLSSFLLPLKSLVMAGEVASQQFEPIVISIPDIVEVQQQSVRLGDIATLEGDNEQYVKVLNELIVSRPPRLGKNLSLSRNVIIRRINSVSKPTQRAFLNMSDSIVLTIPVREIGKDEVIDRVHEFLQQKYAQSNSELDIVRVDFNSGLLVPREEEIKFSFDMERGSSGNKINIRMDVSGREGYRFTQRIPVYINLIEEVVVAIRDIALREVIVPDDVKLAFVNVSNLRKKTIKNLEEVIGKATTKRLKMNAPLLEGNVKEMPVISRGAAVTIVADGGAFRITVPGVAQQNGFQGQMIRVVNINSRKKIFAKVLDSKTVQVQF